MIADGNIKGKWSEKKMEGEDGLRIVECLRGRLLAERAASGVAKEDAEQMRNKLIKLESQLRVEVKSRNRAEKKLKLLTKKLESLNIQYVSDESEHSSLSEKSEISSVSTGSSSTNQPEDKAINPQITTPMKCEIEEPLKKPNSPVVSENLKHNVSQSSTSGQSHNSPSNEENLGSTAKTYPEISIENESSQSFNDLKADDHSSKSSNQEKEINKENDQDGDGYVDMSLAIVPVDLPKKMQTTDTPIANASVKDLLAALKHAKQKLQSSTERRQMIKVGSR